MADTSQNIKTGEQVKEVIFQEIKNEVAKKGIDVLKLGDNWNKQILKLIEETVSFYLRSNIVLPPKEIASHIFKTKVERELPEKVKKDLNPLESNNQNSRSERRIKPTLETAPKTIEENDRNVKQGQRENSGQKQSKNATEIPPKINSESTTNKDPYREDTEENPQRVGSDENQNQNYEQISNPPRSTPNQNRSNEKENQENKTEPNTDSENRNAETKTNANLGTPPKLNPSKAGDTEDQVKSKKEDAGENNQPPKLKTNSLRQNLQNAKNLLSQAKPKKLSLSTWVTLATGAAIIDFAQGWIGVTVIASVINLFADVFIGLCLFSFFWYHKMLNRKLAISVILGFAVDFISLGIMPAWTFDIFYAWIITDGSKVVGAIPGAGDEIQKALQKVAK